MKNEFQFKKINLENLKEVYQQFKFQFPDVKVEFSKFAELCPKHCVLAGAMFPAKTKCPTAVGHIQYVFALFIRTQS